MQFKSYISFALFLMLPISVYTQTVRGPLPQLFPANVSTYDIDVGLPLSCAYSCEVDQQGRLWINPCFSQEEHRTVNFFQFDGREAISVHWPALPPGAEGQATVIGLDAAGNLIGFFRQTRFCFRFDPDTHEVQLLSVAAEQAQILHMTINRRQQLIAYAVTSDEHRFYNMTADSLQLLAALPLKGSIPGNNLLPHLHLLTEDSYWFFDYELEFEDLNLPEDFAGHLGTFKRIDLATGAIDTYALGAVMGEPIPYPTTLTPTVRLQADREGHVHLFLAPWLRHFEFDPKTEIFSEYQIFEDLAGQMVDHRYQYFFMFRDEVGNFLYAFYNAERAYEALLIDTLGNWYDYSPVLNAAVDQSRFDEGVIYYIKTSDLRKQLYVCMEGGIAAVELKFYNAIRVFSRGKPTRSIAELGPDTYYFVREGDKGAALLEVSDLNAPVLKDFATFDCSGELVQPNAIYGDAKKGPDGSIWLSFKDDLLRIAPDGTCALYPVGNPFEKFVQFNEQQFLLEKGGRLSIYDLQSGKAYPFTHDGRQVTLNARVNQMYQSDDGRIWIATLKGLWQIDMNQNLIKKYDSGNGFLDNRIMCIDADETGWLWLGTYGSGLQLFHPETGELKVVDRKDGLSNNTVVGILRDEQGLRWISSYKGISLLSKDGEVITQLFEADGLSTNEFNRYSYYKDSSGRLLFGSIHGINRIDPELLKAQLLDNGRLRVFLTGLTQYQVGREQEVTRRVNLQLKEPLVLPAAHRYLRLEFALSSYVKPEGNHFSYRILERGRKKVHVDWTYLGASTELNLNNLPAGDLLIELKGSDHRGNWTPESLQIPVDVKEFFYKQTWFYILIGGLIFGSVAAWLYRQRLTRHRLERQIKERTEEILKTRDQLIVQEKLASLGQLTAGIAHEIKNPLNFVNNFAEGSLELLEELEEEITKVRTNIPKQEEALIQELIHELKVNAQDIQHNGRRADRIVRSMMDHASGSKGELQQVQLNELVDENLNLAYHSYRAIDSTFTVKLEQHYQEGLPPVELFSQDFGRVLLNLLNNAFYAINKRRKVAENGFLPLLKVETRAVGQDVQISIRDNGVGIPEAIRKKIFTPFFTTKSTGEGNSGLGLSISYDIVVQQHGGSLEVESEPNAFTEFRIRIPQRQNR